MQCAMSTVRIRYFITIKSDVHQDRGKVDMRVVFSPKFAPITKTAENYQKINIAFDFDLILLHRHHHHDFE